MTRTQLGPNRPQRVHFLSLLRTSFLPSLAWLVLLMISLGLAGQAHAQTSNRTPGSVLIFPVYDFGADRESIITITNTNRDQTACPNGRRVGDVIVEFVYVPIDGEYYCRFEALEPADTLTIIASRHNPGMRERGYLLVEAQDPITHQPIDFDFLIGSARLIDRTNGSQFSYVPYSFQALPTGTQPFGTSGCGHSYVDVHLDPSIAELNFNGVEYSAFPDKIMLDHFVGEGTGGSTPAFFSNRLHLMSTSQTSTGIGILAWNNNVVMTSVDLSMGPAAEMGLKDISNDFRQSLLGNGGRPSEFLGIATGWLEMSADSSQVGILGVYEERITAGTRLFVGARPLQGAGTRTVALPRLGF